MKKEIIKMSKALITIETLTTTSTRTFADKRLEAATAKIVKLYNDTAKYVDAKNREFSKILSQIKTEKSYEKDGFKSVADYAETIFGLSRSNAYALAAAGDIYNDTQMPAEVKALTPSKVAELANVPKDKLEQGIKDGDIAPDKTQKDLREFAKKATATAEPETKVLERYTVRLVAGVVREEDYEDFNTPRDMDAWHEHIKQHIIDTESPSRAPEIIKLPKSAPYTTPLSDKKTVTRYLFITECSAYAFEFYTYSENTKKEKKAKGKKYTKQELLAMLAAYDEDEGDAEDENV